MTTIADDLVVKARELLTASKDAHQRLKEQVNMLERLNSVAKAARHVCEHCTPEALAELSREIQTLDKTP